MILLVRHGACRANPLRPSGDLLPASYEEWLEDPPLSSRGREEALALAPRLEQIGPWDRVLASPRRRTVETAGLALPGNSPAIDERLHEWHGGEPMEALLERVQAVLDEAERGSVLAFTHGGFIRAVVAAVLCGRDPERFGPLFHDLRRGLQVFTASLTPVVHGVRGLEVLATNACPDVEAFTGRPPESF